MFCISSINGFLICLIHLLFTVYILKEKINVAPVTIKIYFFVEHDFMISYCNAYYLIILCSNF